MNKLKILIGETCQDLGESVCWRLDTEPVKVKYIKFPNREISCEILESVREEDVYVIHSIVNTDTDSPNDSLMQLLVTIDALRRSSVKSITAVIPHYGYARQDRQVIPRTPITSRLLADMLQNAGVQRVITVDVHSTQSVGFFTIPVSNLFAAEVLAEYVHSLELEDLLIISPDAGGAARARYFAKRFGADIALIDKRRDKENKAEAIHVVGNVEGKTCVIYDDMIDTAGTLIAGVKALKAHGAKQVYAVAAHGIFSGPAITRISECEDLESVIVTDAVRGRYDCPKIKVVSTAPLLAKAIMRCHEGESVSTIC